jgi:hypothetical protein
VRNFFLAVMAMLSITGPGLAGAADIVVGSVVAVRGDVFADTGSGAQQPLAVNAPVHRGDTIVTGRGKAKVALSDGSILSIGENTRLQISHFTSPDANPTVRLNLLSGVLRPLVSRTTSTGSFEVETQTAIAAVRGTEWLMEATADNTAVALLRGRVAVSSRDDRRASVLLRSPGQGTDVARGQPPKPPVPWGRQRLADLLVRATYN